MTAVSSANPEVVVIGGGPAGSTVSTLLAKHMRTAFDRGNHAASRCGDVNSRGSVIRPVNADAATVAAGLISADGRVNDGNAIGIATDATAGRCGLVVAHRGVGQVKITFQDPKRTTVAAGRFVLG